MSAARDHQRNQGLVLILKTLTDKQLVEVLAGVGASLDHPTDTGPRRRGKPCGTCGLIYPECRRRWTGDHEFEAKQ